MRTTPAQYLTQATFGLNKSFENLTKLNVKKFLSSGIFNVSTGAEFTKNWTSTESLSGAKQLGDAENPPVVSLQDGYPVTLEAKRFGSAIEINEREMREMLASGKFGQRIDEYYKKQERAMKRNIDFLMVRDTAFDLWNNAFVDTKYTSPDGIALCGVHVYKSGATFENSKTGKLTTTNVDIGYEYAGTFKDGENLNDPLNFDIVLVQLGSENSRSAKRIFNSNIVPETVGNVNIYQGDRVKIVEVPFLTDVDHWFMIDSSRYEGLPYIGIVEAPTLKAPIIQNNQGIRQNATGFWQYGHIDLPTGILGFSG